MLQVQGARSSESYPSCSPLNHSHITLLEQRNKKQQSAISLLLQSDFSADHCQFESGPRLQNNEVSTKWWHLRLNKLMCLVWCLVLDLLHPPTSWLHMSTRKLKHLLLNVRASLSKALPGRSASTRCVSCVAAANKGSQLFKSHSVSHFHTLLLWPFTASHSTNSTLQLCILFLHPHGVKDELMGRISSSCVATFSPTVFFPVPLSIYSFSNSLVKLGVTKTWAE